MSPLLIVDKTVILLANISPLGWIAVNIYLPESKAMFNLAIPLPLVLRI